jgi:hypothetical protein
MRTGEVLGRVMTYNGTTAWLRQLGGNGRDIIACEEDLPGTIRAGARVTYAIAQDPDNQKRSRAVDIKLRDRQPLRW